MRYCNRRLSLLVLGLLLALGIFINLHRVSDKGPPAAAAGTVARKQELGTVTNLSQSESTESFQTESTTKEAAQTQTSEVPQAAPGVYQSRYQFAAATLPPLSPLRGELARTAEVPKAAGRACEPLWRWCIKDSLCPIFGEAESLVLPDV